MKSNYDVKGGISVEFLICRTSCGSKCNAEPCPNEKKEIKLLEPVIFYLADHTILKIREGFIFDGASIPKICWTSIGHPLEHRFLYAALLHDALYSSQLVSREKADQYFKEFLQSFSGIGTFTVWKIHTGVRLFGGTAWKSKTEEYLTEMKQFITMEGSK